MLGCFGVLLTMHDRAGLLCCSRATMQVAVPVSQGPSILLVPASASGDAPALASLALCASGTVLFTSPCCLLAFDPAAGSLAWNHSLTAPGSNLAVGAADDVIFLDMAPDNRTVVLVALNGTSGVVQYSYPVASSPVGTGLGALPGVALGGSGVAVITVHDVLMAVNSKCCCNMERRGARRRVVRVRK